MLSLTRSLLFFLVPAEFEFCSTRRRHALTDKEKECSLNSVDVSQQDCPASPCPQPTWPSSEDPTCLKHSESSFQLHQHHHDSFSPPPTDLSKTVRCCEVSGFRFRHRGVSVASARRRRATIRSSTRWRRRAPPARDCAALRRRRGRGGICSARAVGR